MKILVTGGAGYVGSHVVYHLIANGIDAHNIVVIDNLCRGSPLNIHPDVEFYKADIRDQETLRNLLNRHKTEFVLHFAAFAYVGESIEKPLEYYDNNVNGLISMLSVLKEFPIRGFVFSSTCSLYGNANLGLISENSKIDLLNPYAKSKKICEEIIEDYCITYGTRYISLRYFNAAGAAYNLTERHSPETHLIPIVIDCVRRKQPIKVYGNDYSTPDGTCVRDYIHVLDLADAHLLALKYLASGNFSEIINIGTGNGASVLEVIRYAEKVSNNSAIIEYSDRRSGDPEILVSNNAKAKKLLRWSPKKGMLDIINDTWESRNV